MAQAGEAQQIMGKFGWEILMHPAYSPGLHRRRTLIIIFDISGRTDLHITIVIGVVNSLRVLSYHKTIL